MSISSVGGKANFDSLLSTKGAIAGYNGTETVSISASTSTATNIALSVDTTSTSKIGTVSISSSTVTSGYTLIASSTLTASAATVTLSSIPETYKALYVYVNWSPTTTAAVDFQTKWNTTTSYSVISMTSISSSPGVTGSNNGSWSYGYVVGDSLSTPTNDTNYFRMVFPNYASGSKERVALVQAGFAQPTDSSKVIGVAAIVANSLTTAITSLEFSVSSGNIASGSSFLLYGFKV